MVAKKRSASRQPPSNNDDNTDSMETDQDAVDLRETAEPKKGERSARSHAISQRILETVFRFYEGTKEDEKEELDEDGTEDVDVDGVTRETDSTHVISTEDRNIVNREMHGNGLVYLARIYKVHGIVTPKRKIWIILLGNHSAGKSSFINWYIDYPVQKTSVAIETTSFTLITSGNSRETFGGPATLQLFNALKPMADLKGLLPSLATEIVPSRHRNFDMITFIDTPGLVDGGVKYPFQPEIVLTELVKEADLVFTFFDPIGQALCARTMNVVESICQSQGFKIHFYLSKADTIPDESDRQRVLIQIAQSLTHRIQDRQFSLDIPPIYIPSDDNACVPVRNHMPGVLSTIDGTIAQGVQKSLGALLRDCGKVRTAVRGALEVDERARRFNQRDFGRGLFLLMAALGPLVVFLAVGLRRSLDLISKTNGPEALGVGGELLLQMLDFLDGFVAQLTYSNIAYIFGASLFALILWWFFVKKRPVLGVDERREMEGHLRIVEEVLPRRHEALYKEYFEAHVTKG
ncbi:hypothetical protein BC830DRAFT_1083313 [Chytriomyces sp. MP71]|nr:hypothetical protein BC830DRAFT_1083313 [Chytriomyces sp. MP71]